MADFTDSVLQILQQNGDLQINEIMKHLKTDKKTLNKKLYSLKQQGVVVKVLDSPPTWRLSRDNQVSGEISGNVESECYGPLASSSTSDEDLVATASSHKSRIPPHRNIGPHAHAKVGKSGAVQSRGDIEERLIEHLRVQRLPLTIKAINKGVKGKINLIASALNGLLRNHLIVKSSTKPPKYSLNREMYEGDETNADEIKQDNQDMDNLQYSTEQDAYSGMPKLEGYEEEEYEKHQKEGPMRTTSEKDELNISTSEERQTSPKDDDDSILVMISQVTEEMNRDLKTELKDTSSDVSESVPTMMTEVEFNNSPSEDNSCARNVDVVQPEEVEQSAVSYESDTVTPRENVNIALSNETSIHNKNIVKDMTEYQEPGADNIENEDTIVNLSVKPEYDDESLKSSQFLSTSQKDQNEIKPVEGLLPVSSGESLVQDQGHNARLVQEFDDSTDVDMTDNENKHKELDKTGKKGVKNVDGTEIDHLITDNPAENGNNGNGNNVNTGEENIGSSAEQNSEIFTSQRGTESCETNQQDVHSHLEAESETKRKWDEVDLSIKYMRMDESESGEMETDMDDTIMGAEADSAGQVKPKQEGWENKSVESRGFGNERVGSYTDFGSPTSPIEGSDEVIDQVLIILAQEPDSTLPANELARRLGFHRKKEINKMLYEAQKNKLIQKVQESPPLWHLTYVGRMATEGIRKNRGSNTQGLMSNRHHNKVESNQNQDTFSAGSSIPMSPAAFLIKQGYNSSNFAPPAPRHTLSRLGGRGFGRGVGTEMTQFGRPKLLNQSSGPSQNTMPFSTNRAFGSSAIAVPGFNSSDMPGSASKPSGSVRMSNAFFSSSNMPDSASQPFITSGVRGPVRVPGSLPSAVETHIAVGRGRGLTTSTMMINSRSASTTGITSRMPPPKQRPKKEPNVHQLLKNINAQRAGARSRNSQDERSGGSASIGRGGPPPSPMDLVKGSSVFGSGGNVGPRTVEPKQVNAPRFGSLNLPNTNRPQQPQTIASNRFPFTQMSSKQLGTSSDQNKLLSGLSCSSGATSSPGIPSLLNMPVVPASLGNQPQSLPNMGSQSRMVRPFMDITGASSTMGMGGPSSLTSVGDTGGSPLGLASIKSGGPSVAGTASPTVSGEMFAALNKNPISALMEYAQTRKMRAEIEVLSSYGPPHRPKFRIAAIVGRRQFPAIEATNKKDGKREAADLALRKLIAEGEYKVQAAPTPSEKAASMGFKATVFDRIAGLAHRHFNQLAALVPEGISGRKVLAAMIMKVGDQSEGTVISLGTGNRCITGHYLSLEGHTVNDSHAEIITRRGLVRFLYNNLLTYQPGSADSLFELPSGDGKCALKAGITFHLYISTAPCGDGALFSPRDASTVPIAVNEKDMVHTPTFSSNVQGVLRTKIEGGEGTIPLDSEFETQTWDGILRGERLRTMSCSDKICRWNLLGLQGALLTHFIKPIYLSSLTLGLLYDHGHLARATCCRLEHGSPDIRNDLPPDYSINHPHLGRVTAYDPPRETEKTKSMSLNWSLGDRRPEVTDGTKGCLDRKGPERISQVAKIKLYDLFKQVCQKYGQQELLQAESYQKAKKMATDFQMAKKALYLKFKNKGPWVSKPPEEKMFSWGGTKHTHLKEMNMDSLLQAL